MSFFRDNSKYYKDLNILILGSYDPQYFHIVQEMKQVLIKEGFSNAEIGSDIPEENFLEKSELGLEYIQKTYLKINRAMKQVHFNLFLFFDTKNESTQTELMSLIQDNYLKENSEKVLVFFPANLYATILEGFVSFNKLNVFRYQSEVEIYQKSINYLRQNIFSL